VHISEYAIAEQWSLAYY